LRESRPAREVNVVPKRQRSLQALQLLSAKPVLYVANVDEASAASGNAQSNRVSEYTSARGARSVTISAAAIERRSHSSPMPTIRASS
jgi:ribosome-binding ATPase